MRRLILAFLVFLPASGATAADETPLPVDVQQFVDDVSSGADFTRGKYVGKLNAQSVGMLKLVQDCALHEAKPTPDNAGVVVTWNCPNMEQRTTPQAWLRLDKDKIESITVVQFVPVGRR